MASSVVDLHNQSRRCIIDARSAASRGQNAIKATQVQNSGSEAAAVDAAKADRDWLSHVEVGRHDRQNSFLVAKRLGLGGSPCGRMVGTGKTILGETRIPHQFVNSAVEGVYPSSSYEVS
jgi:hypothetical protein